MAFLSAACESYVGTGSELRGGSQNLGEGRGGQKERPRGESESGRGEGESKKSA